MPKFRQTSNLYKVWHRALSLVWLTVLTYYVLINSTAQIRYFPLIAFSKKELYSFSMLHICSWRHYYCFPKLEQVCNFGKIWVSTYIRNFDFEQLNHIEAIPYLFSGWGQVVVFTLKLATGRPSICLYYAQTGRDFLVQVLQMSTTWRS